MQTIDSTDYVLGHDNHELARLMNQAAFYGELTHELFRLAGISAGMTVVDVGCGAGDVSFLAAAMVGPSGRVLGVDKSPDAIATATARAEQAGLRNVRFEVGEVASLAIDQPVDAIVGRLVLLYMPDPSATLAQLATLVKPGGVLAFQEMDMPAGKTSPPCSLFDDTLASLCETFRRVGCDPQIALRLGPIFERAGLPSPKMIQGARVERGPGNAAAAQLAQVTRTLLPAMERTGVATLESIDIDTLEARVLEQMLALDATAISPPLIGAWTRTHRVTR